MAHISDEQPEGREISRPWRHQHVPEAKLVGHSGGMQGPTPPYANRSKSRGSCPRMIEIFLMLAVVCAATIEMIPGALPVEPDLSREPVDRIGCQCYIKADLAWSARRLSSRPSTRLASVTVTSLPQRPKAARAGRAQPDPRSRDPLPKRDRSGASVDAVGLDLLRFDRIGPGSFHRLRS